MELGRAVLHGLLYVQHKGQRLVLHLQRPYALGRRHLVLCQHYRYLVAPVPHMTVQQQTVRHILMTGVGGPGMACRRKGDVRHVKECQDLHYPRNGLRRRNVNALYNAVGYRRMTDFRDQSLLPAQVVRILCAACRFLIRVYPGYAFAYALAHTYLRFN